jgi:hypothetical protein
MKKIYILIIAICLGGVVNAQTPTITSFSPDTGSVGTLITIIGTNLSNPTLFNIGGTSAIIVSKTATKLVGMIMPGTITGNITVTNSSGTALSNSNFVVTPTPFPAYQQGNKLVGSGYSGNNIQQGTSVAISADGNTAIVGAPYDNNKTGAAWIYIRSGGVWIQQGNKLIATDAVYGSDGSGQGCSVAISADGNTAIVGGVLDNNLHGAAWIYTRNGSVWTQQGSKLFGTDYIGLPSQGCSVSLSADGNTAIVGGYSDNNDVGAVWIFTRSGSIWTQQGSKLVGTGAGGNGYAYQGNSVSLSADGNTAIVGGILDYNQNGSGAAWIFTRSGSIWTQQGSKLMGIAYGGNVNIGYSVALSADGNTAIVGGTGDNYGLGSAWIYTRNGNVWIQQGIKLVGTGAININYSVNQGSSVSLSADGNTALIGGYHDNQGKGATWKFTRNGGVWTQQSSKLVGTGYIGDSIYQGCSVSLSADGSTAITGGFGDNHNIGAAWIFITPYKDTITTVANPIIGGITNGDTIIAKNSSVTVHASANPGYIFTKWCTTTDTTTLSNNANYTFWATSNLKLVANFIYRDTITTVASPSIGGITTGDTIVNNNSTVTVHAIANQGYVFSNWCKTTDTTIISTNANYTFVATSDLKLVANFKYPDTITTIASPTIGGITKGDTIIGDNLPVTVHAIPNPGYIFIKWCKTTDTTTLSTNENYTFNATSNLNLVGTFQVLPPSITSFFPTSGSIGTLLTVNVTYINSLTSLTIGGTSAIIVSKTATQLVCMVMPGTTSGIISITTLGGTTNSGSNFIVLPTSYPTYQQGSKLIGAGINYAQQGQSVSLSADGNTAIVGGPAASNYLGAAWIYTRNGGGWSQQGKLVGSGYIGSGIRQGISVSLSADGNTAIVGGWYDNWGVGAAWVYTRSGGIWTQQGNKLVGTGYVGNANQGWSVSLSADGNTAIVSGYCDNNNVGASWVYTRSGGIWTQQGSKLVGTGYIGSTKQGYSVSLSAEGNTAIVGGYNDNSNLGAAWVFTRSGGLWTQQGNKLVGTGATIGANQGTSVSLSADGNTAIVGGDRDDSQLGAAWIFTRNGGVWAQQGNKLVGTGYIATSTGTVLQGTSVSLSADGNTAILGGSYDNNKLGAVWLFKRSGGVWTQQGNKLVGTGAINNGLGVYQGTSVSLSDDGSTAIVGGYSDSTYIGASWIFVSQNIVYNTITTNASPTIGGLTSGDTIIINNSSVTVHAIAKPGYVFTKWCKITDTTTLSTNANYTFIATSNLNLVGNFKIIQPICSAQFDLVADTAVLHHYFVVNNASGVPPLQYNWSWGDGTFSTTAYPTHTYSAAGYYNICLSITDSVGCSVTYCDSSYLQKDPNAIVSVQVIPQGTLGISNLSTDKIKIYPNPAKDNLIIELNGNQDLRKHTISIYNIEGQLIKQLTTKQTKTEIDIQEFSVGVYVVKVNSDKGSFVSRFVKE